jgi:hypothetical protein
MSNNPKRIGSPASRILVSKTTIARRRDFMNSFVKALVVIGCVAVAGAMVYDHSQRLEAKDTAVKKANSGFSADGIAFKTNGFDKKIDDQFAQLNYIAKQHNRLTKLIDAGNITDIERDELKRKRSLEQMKGENLIDDIEKEVSKFEHEFAVCQAAITQLQYDPKFTAENRALEATKRAADNLPKLKKRIAAMKSAWNQYITNGKPLPNKV